LSVEAAGAFEQSHFRLGFSEKKRVGQSSLIEPLD
jgi:hypothetical protein